MKKIGRFFSQRIKRQGGTTLVEMIVTLLLISIMLAMATASLSSASKVFVRVQKTQYAQSILDTLMTEMRGITENATGYVKIYETAKSVDNIAGKAGNSTGNALEFINNEGYVELITTEAPDSKRAATVNVYGADNELTGATQLLEPGQLFIRYYVQRNSDSNIKLYNYYKGTQTLIARAITPVYGSGFYMGNYVKVRYSVPDGTNSGNQIDCINITVSLHSDSSCTEENKIAEDEESLYFRNPVIYTTEVTAIYNSNTLN